MTDDARLRAHLDGLPIGRRPDVDPDGLVGWSIFPFETQHLRARVLEPPVLPEPAREGEAGRLRTEFSGVLSGWPAAS